MKAGDAWWSAAEKQSTGEKQQALARAGFWYRQAIDELGGLNQIKVQKRLDELPAAVADSGATGGAAPTAAAPTANGPAGKPVEPAPGGKSVFLSELQPRDVHLFPGVRWSEQVNFDGAPSRTDFKPIPTRKALPGWFSICRPSFAPCKAEWESMT